MFEIVALIMILFLFISSHVIFNKYEKKIAELQMIIDDIYDICMLNLTDKKSEEIDSVISEILEVCFDSYWDNKNVN